MGIYDFYIRYISLNLKDYPSIGIDLDINSLLIVVMIGLIVGTVFINRKRALMALTVGRLLRKEAVGEENAKTLSSLGIDTKSVRKMLSSGGQIKSLVKIAGEEKITYEEYIKLSKNKGYKGESVCFDSAELYLDPATLDTSKKLISSRSYTPLNTVLFCILIFSAFVCLMLAMPEILSLIDTFLAGQK